MKSLLSIATAAVAFAVTIAPVQARPRWATALAEASCGYLRMGYSTEAAGRNGTRDVLKGPHSGAFIAASQNGTMKPVLVNALLQTCPDALLQASRTY